MSHSTQNRSFRRHLSSWSLGLVLKKLNPTQQKQTTPEQKCRKQQKEQASINLLVCMCISLCSTSQSVLIIFHLVSSQSTLLRVSGLCILYRTLRHCINTVLLLLSLLLLLLCCSVNLCLLFLCVAGSRSSSPSGRLSYLTHTQQDFSRRSSGGSFAMRSAMPRSQGSSREASPSRLRGRLLDCLCGK